MRPSHLSLVVAAAAVAAFAPAAEAAPEPPITAVTARSGGLVVHRGDGERLPTTHRIARSTAPTLSPDGKRLAYVTSDGRARHVLVRTLSTQVALVVATAPVSGAALAFDPAGERLVVASEAGVSIVPVTGRPAVRIPLPRAWRGSRFAAVSFAPDGRTIVASRTWGDGRRGTLANAAVAFRTDGTGARELYRTRNPYSEQARPVLSPDGRRVAIAARGAIVAVPIGGGRSTRLFAPVAAASIGDPLFSPDGSRVAFARTPSRGVADVWIVDSSGGTPRRITVTPIPKRGTPKTGSSPVAWSPDGAKLLVFRHDRFAVVDVATRSSTSVGLSRADVVVGPGRWTDEARRSGSGLRPLASAAPPVVR